MSDDEQFLYLTTKGRVSGLPRTIEIWFVEVEGRHYIVSGDRENSGWVKNLMRDPSVRFRVGTPGDGAEPVEGTARVLDDSARKAAVAKAMHAKYGWSDGLIVEITRVGDELPPPPSS